MAQLVEDPKPASSLRPPDPSDLLPKRLAHSRPLFDPEILRRATKDSFVKLNPATLIKNPVMFVVEVGAALTTVLLVRNLFAGATETGFQIQIALWLWFTVLFANFAEAMAEARGKAQADALRKTKTDTIAKRQTSSGRMDAVPASQLRSGDVVSCEASDIHPGRWRSDRDWRSPRWMNPSLPAKALP